MCGYCVQSWFIGVRFFKAEICSGSHSLRGYQWSLKDSGARLRTRIARGDQKNQKTPAPDHFWKLRCSKSVHRCGAKHISKSKCTKHFTFGPLLEVEMCKKCTPLWCEAHVEVKSVKNWRVRSTFGRLDVVLRGRRKGFCTLSKVSKTWGVW